MLRLYERLRKYAVTMIIEPDVVREDYLYISFKKDDRESTARHIHVDLIRLVSDKAESILVDKLERFIGSLE